MKGTQNQLERFQMIAKKLVDEHSAEVFTRSAISSEGVPRMTDEVYHSHLDVLGKELNEQAEQFIGNFKAVNEDVKSEIWNTCRKYIDQFVRRNQPSYY
jgi:hypothetical protein